MAPHPGRSKQSIAPPSRSASSACHHGRRSRLWAPSVNAGHKATVLMGPFSPDPSSGLQIGRVPTGLNASAIAPPETKLTVRGVPHPLRNRASSDNGSFPGSRCGRHLERAFDPPGVTPAVTGPQSVRAPPTGWPAYYSCSSGDAAGQAGGKHSDENDVRPRLSSAV
jgi:hypothetical protein